MTTATAAMMVGHSDMRGHSDIRRSSGSRKDPQWQDRSRSPRHRDVSTGSHGGRCRNTDDEAQPSLKLHKAEDF